MLLRWRIQRNNCEVIMTDYQTAIKENRIAQNLNPNCFPDLSINVNTAFTLGYNVQKPEYLRKASRDEIVASIRSGELDGIDVKGMVEKIRATTNKEERTRLKLCLPWFSGGQYIFKRCLDDWYQANYIILDVDQVEYAEAMKDFLELIDKSIDFVFTSPSKGLKFVYRLASPIHDEASYVRAYRWLAQDLKAKLNLTADEGARSRAQACYSSYDPELWESCRSQPLDVSKLPVEEPQAPRAKVIDFPESAVVRTPADTAKTFQSSTFAEDYELAEAIVSYLIAKGEISYEHWRKTAYAIKARFGEYGRELFLMYADNNAYRDDRESLSRFWDSLGIPSSISFPSLIWVATQYGWVAS